MKRWLLSVLIVLAVMVSSGCMKMKSEGARAPAPMQPARAGEAMAGRMLIWSASLSLEVGNVSNAAAQAAAIVAAGGGYVETTSLYGEESGHVRLRVPSGKLDSALDELAALGKETSRYVSSRDVTEEYVDVDARLKNAVALRDRLRELLKQATEVKDILNIERELSRVQGDIDSMEARLKALKGQVDLAAIDLSLQQKRIYGPLGYLFRGIGWVVEKLFVIR